MKVLILLFAFITNFKTLFSQVITQSQKNEIWLKSRQWEVDDIKHLLEEKADKSTISKEATQKWILEKLTAYTPMHYTQYSEADASGWSPASSIDYDVVSKNIYFDGKYLVFHFVNKYIYTPKGGFPNKQKYEDRTDSVSISDLSNIASYKSQIYFSYLGNSESLGNHLLSFLQFDFTRETDIELRLKKAFVHLCSFYWHSVKNESF